MMRLLFVIVLLLNLPHAAYSQQKIPLTAAGNAAMLDLYLTTLLWESQNRNATESDKTDFLTKLGLAIHEGLAQAPTRYKPISPCFQFTYRSASLTELVTKTFKKMPDVTDNDTLASHVKFRLNEQTECAPVEQVAKAMKLH